MLSKDTERLGNNEGHINKFDISLKFINHSLLTPEGLPVKLLLQKLGCSDNTYGIDGYRQCSAFS